MGCSVLLRAPNDCGSGCEEEKEEGEGVERLLLCSCGGRCCEVGVGGFRLLLMDQPLRYRRRKRLGGKPGSLAPAYKEMTRYLPHDVASVGCTAVLVCGHAVASHPNPIVSFEASLVPW